MPSGSFLGDFHKIYGFGMPFRAFYQIGHGSGGIPRLFLKNMKSSALCVSGLRKAWNLQRLQRVCAGAPGSGGKNKNHGLIMFPCILCKITIFVEFTYILWILLKSAVLGPPGAQGAETSVIYMHFMVLKGSSGEEKLEFYVKMQNH